MKEQKENIEQNRLVIFDSNFVTLLHDRAMLNYSNCGNETFVQIVNINGDNSAYSDCLSSNNYL